MSIEVPERSTSDVLETIAGACRVRVEHRHQTSAKLRSLSEKLPRSPRIDLAASCGTDEAGYGRRAAAAIVDDVVPALGWAGPQSVRSERSARAGLRLLGDAMRKALAFSRPRDDRPSERMFEQWSRAARSIVKS
jgi:hypothetical protein